MAQSQGFLNPHVPPTSPLTFCAVFFQQQVGAAPPSSPSQELGNPMVPLAYPALWRWQRLPSRL